MHYPRTHARSLARSRTCILARRPPLASEGAGSGMVSRFLMKVVTSCMGGQQQGWSWIEGGGRGGREGWVGRGAYSENEWKVCGVVTLMRHGRMECV